LPVLCYQIATRLYPNERSTTGAEDGHLFVLLKQDHPQAKAQVYSELVANRLAMFLGLPVAMGVPAKENTGSDELAFASLRAHEADQDFYDFTADDHRAIEPPDNAPDGMFSDVGHIEELLALSQLYPKELSFLAVFDLWIGNEDRPLNFKAELSKGERGILFAVDHGSSLLACRANIDASLELLQKENFPRFHPFQKLVNPMFAGQMIERITSMPDWAIEAATVYNDIVGKVTIADQYALYEVLIQRKRHLAKLVEYLL
jgi:hypothetical protein